MTDGGKLDIGAIGAVLTGLTQVEELLKQRLTEDGI